MPQMAPILWFWFFYFMLFSLLVLTSILFFQISLINHQMATQPYCLNPYSWLW